MDCIEKYGLLELRFSTNGEDCVIPGARFTKGELSVEVPAFRDGEQYVVRFMPCDVGEWKYKTVDGSIAGTFTCVGNTGENHGPVVTSEYSFRHADGSRYIPFGTTCYAWTHQTNELQEQTLKTLETSPFNKVRMCVFPKSMPYNNNEPELFPFYRKEDGGWDVGRPDERFWRHLDRRLCDLMERGIQADLILFHPYDRWGFSLLTQEESLLYLRYCIARLSAFRNVWWSLANEYDLVMGKTDSDWDAYGEMIAEQDPYHHLTSIHNCFALYPKRDWMTHCSVQNGNVQRVLMWQNEYDLPVVIDECGYEGNIEYGWGNLTAFEMVHRIWTAVIRGGFCTHGETFHREDEVLWWAKGGVLHGESAKRIAFLKELLYSLEDDLKPNTGFMNMDPNASGEPKPEHEVFISALMRIPADQMAVILADLIPAEICSENYRLQYLGRSRPVFTHIELPVDSNYRIEAIDVWEMTRTVIAEHAHGHTRLDLPAKEGIAILCIKEEGLRV